MQSINIATNLDRWRSQSPVGDDVCSCSDHSCIRLPYTTSNSLSIFHYKIPAAKNCDDTYSLYYLLLYLIKSILNPPILHNFNEFSHDLDFFFIGIDVPSIGPQQYYFTRIDTLILYIEV